MNEELLSTLIEGIALQKEKIDDINDTLEILSNETKANQDTIIKTKEVLEKQIENIILSTQKMIDKVATSVEAEKVDYMRVESSIKAKLNRYITQKDTDIAEVRADLKSFIKTIMPKDGKDSDDKAILIDLKRYVLDNRGDFIGPSGPSGPSGPMGNNGDDGVGIKSITTKDKKLFITLTDGTVKKFDMPSITISGGGGGGINYYALSNIQEPLLNDDEFMIFRNGTPYKVKLSVLNGYFGNELPINTMTDINGQGYTDLDGSYYTTI